MWRNRLKIPLEVKQFTSYLPIDYCLMRIGTDCQTNSWFLITNFDVIYFSLPNPKLRVYITYLYLCLSLNHLGVRTLLHWYSNVKQQCLKVDQETGHVMWQIHHFDWLMMDLEHCKTNRKLIFGDKTKKYCLWLFTAISDSILKYTRR